MRWTGCVAVMLILLAGCESKPKDPFEDYFASQLYKDYVPLEAVNVTAGTGVLTYKATQPGRVYVADMDNMFEIQTFKKPRVIVVSTIAQDESVRFDPAAREFQVGTQNIIRMTKVTAGHQHEMRFIATGERE